MPRPRRAPATQGFIASGALKPAATFIAIRAAFWLGAAATLIWAPAPERRLIGDAYGPLTDFLFQALSQWDARWFLQISLHGYEEVPQAAAFFPVYPAVVHSLTWVDRLGARRGRADLTRRRRSCGLGAGATRAAAARRARCARRGALLRALSRLGSSSRPSTPRGSSSLSPPARSSLRRGDGRCSRACSAASRPGLG